MSYDNQMYCNVCDYYLDDNQVCGECGGMVEDYNTIEKPYHYNHSDGIECIDYIKQVLGKEGFIAYCRGNLMKYNHRAFYKGNPAEDMSKANQYLIWANETLKEMDEESEIK